MPELPEVETIKNDLRALVVGRRIVGVKLLDPRLVRFPTPSQFISELPGHEILAVDRRAKYLIIHLSGGSTLVVQLMITGQLLLMGPSPPISKSTRLVLDLDSGEQLRLADTSHYAVVKLVTSKEEWATRLPLAKLGPEAIAPDLTKEHFTAMLAERHRPIKPLLLDQTFVAGLGNIYVDETLFAARIHPERLASALTAEEAGRIYDAFRRILQESIRRRGTTTRSYRDVLGRKGSYQDQLQVFARTGEKCRGCPGEVAKITLAGRDTYFCPNCQRLETTERAAEVGR